MCQFCWWCPHFFNFGQWVYVRDVTDTRRVQSKTKGVGNFSWNGVNTKNTWRSKTRLRLRNVLWNVETNSPFLSCWSLVLTYVKARAIDFECFVCSSSGQVCDWAFNETACRCAEQARASRLSRPRTSSPIVGFFEIAPSSFCILWCNDWHVSQQKVIGCFLKH